MSMNGVKTYYIEIGDGIKGRNLDEMRRLAIDYLWLHPKDSTVTVYTSKTKKIVVGEVIYTKSRPLFLWSLPNGRIRTLYRSGSVYKKPN